MLLHILMQCSIQPLPKFITVSPKCYYQCKAYYYQQYFKAFLEAFCLEKFFICHIVKFKSCLESSLSAVNLIPYTTKDGRGASFRFGKQSLRVFHPIEIFVCFVHRLYSHKFIFCICMIHRCGRS